MYLKRGTGSRNGNPLQYSCLENPLDGGAWWAAVHGVAKSRTRLSDFIPNYFHPSLQLYKVFFKSYKLREIRKMGEETIGTKIWILKSRNMSGKWLYKHKNYSLSSCGER